MPRKLANKRKASDPSLSGHGAPAKRKATQIKKDLINEIALPEPTEVYAEQVAARINLSNRLHILPRDMKFRVDKSWYFYDIIEPAPQFRGVGQDYKEQENKPTYVSEGEDSDALSDSPGQGKLPVSWSGYRYATHHPLTLGTHLTDSTQAKIHGGGSMGQETAGCHSL